MTLFDLAQQAGLSPKWVASTEGGEFHSACPVCGGNDRFRIHPHKRQSKCEGTYQCRKCGVRGDSLKFATQFLNYSFKEAFDLLGNGQPFLDKKIFEIPNEWRPFVVKAPPNQWRLEANDFVDTCHRRLLLKNDVMESLEKRGIDMHSIMLYELGWNDKNLFLPRKSWGLEEAKNEYGEPRSLWIPKGLVIPFIEEGKLGNVARLKIRRFGWKEGDKIPKYVAVSGSMNGMSIMGNEGRKHVIIVESELDAMAIDCVMGHTVCAIAVGGALKAPDNLTNHIASRAENLLICFDNDKAGKHMMLKWQKWYPKAISFPVKGFKDLGEAIEGGFDIVKWLNKALTLTAQDYVRDKKDNDERKS